MISDAGLTALSNGLSNNNSLTNLSIWRNRFCADGAKSLGIALAINSSIKIITINMNSIGVEGALAIANGLESNSSLVELNVAGNGIGNQGAIHLALALQKNSSVDKLGLCNNNIGDEGAVALALALDNKPCFKSLDLHTNKIGIQGGNAFLQLLKNSFHRGHPSWIDFWLDFNPVKNENVFHELEGQRKKNYEYLNDFKAAVEREDVNKVQGFLDKGLNIDAQDNDGYTALHHSARYGSVKMVKYLVDHGACITKPTPFNHTALDLAKELNHTKVIEFLSTCLNTRHDSPLAKVEKASLNRDSKVVSVVYKLPAQSEKLSVDSTKLISTLQSSLKGDIKEIIKAAAKGDIEALVSYVSQGIDIDAIGSNGVTPLMSAVYVGQLDTVKWFSLQKNINFEKRNNYGYTLFLISAVGGKLDIGKWLIEQKSTRLNDLDYNHNTPFMLASYHGHLAFVEWLVNEKFQIHIAASKGIICANNIYGQNAIQLATIAGKLHVLKWLAAKLTIGNSGKWFTENQSYYTCVDKTGNTLLHLAAYYGHQHIVEWIVEAKITNVGSLNRDKQTASEVAEYNGYTDVAEFLNACHSNSSSTFHAVSPKSKKTEEAVVQKIVTSSIKPDSSLSEYLELDAGSKQLQEQFASSPEGSNLSRLTSPSIPLLKPSKPLAKGIVKPAPLKTYDNDVKESAELDARLKIMQERIEAVPKPKNTPHAETYTILNKPIAILKPSKPLAKGIVNPAPLKTYDNDVKESAELDALLKIMQERIEAIPKPKGLPTPIPNTNSNKPIPLVKSSKPQAQGLFKPAYVKSERAESETPTELPYRLKKAPQQR
jgi:ankyrin repeat protein